MATIEISSFFSPLVNNKRKLDIEAETLDDFLSQLTVSFPLLKPYLIDNDGQINSFINIYVNGENIRFLQDPIQLNKSDVLNILPTIAGG